MGPLLTPVPTLFLDLLENTSCSLADRSIVTFFVPRKSLRNCVQCQFRQFTFGKVGSKCQEPVVELLVVVYTQSSREVRVKFEDKAQKPVCFPEPSCVYRLWTSILLHRGIVRDLVVQNTRGNHLGLQSNAH